MVDQVEHVPPNDPLSTVPSGESHSDGASQHGKRMKVLAVIILPYMPHLMLLEHYLGHCSLCNRTVLLRRIGKSYHRH
ncbi:hypothetical protein ACP5PY_24525 [Photobacterium leiognathi subsp. mandapamensis]